MRHVWRVGPIPCAIPPTSSVGGGGGGSPAQQSPYLHSLGDTAVDFDIAPPRVVSTGDDTRDVNSSQINVGTTHMGVCSGGGSGVGGAFVHMLHHQGMSNVRRDKI